MLLTTMDGVDLQAVILTHTDTIADHAMQVQWKMMQRGTYVLGLEPANGWVEGRAADRDERPPRTDQHAQTDRHRRARDRRAGGEWSRPSSGYRLPVHRYGYRRIRIGSCCRSRTCKMVRFSVKKLLRTT